MVPDFAAEVKGFPSNVTNPDNLIKHFQEFGEVLEVVLARNYSNTLMYNRRQAVLENKVIIEQKRVSK